jgi:hypothetical protein
MTDFGPSNDDSLWKNKTWLLFVVLLVLWVGSGGLDRVPPGGWFGPVDAFVVVGRLASVGMFCLWLGNTSRYYENTKWRSIGSRPDGVAVPKENHGWFIFWFYFWLTFLFFALIWSRDIAPGLGIDPFFGFWPS